MIRVFFSRLNRGNRSKGDDVLENNKGVFLSIQEGPGVLGGFNPEKASVLEVWGGGRSHGGIRDGRMFRHSYSLHMGGNSPQC